MSEWERGEIRNRANAKQLRDFRGLQFERGITPTDIDAFLDFGDKLFVFVEAKHGRAEPPTGQRIALERVCTATQSSGRESYVLLAHHDTPSTQDVDLATATVSCVFHKHCWRPVRVNLTVREAIDGLRATHGITETRDASRT